MEDSASGSMISESPEFGFTPSSRTLPEAKQVDTSPNDASQVPLKAPHPKSTLSSSPPCTSTAPAVSFSNASSATLAPTSSPHPVSTTGPVSNSSASASALPSSIPNVLLSRRPPNPASFAVPLAIVLLMFLVGVWLAIRHHRKLAKDRAADTEKLAQSSMRTAFDSSKISISGADADASDEREVAAAVPVPLFMPAPANLPRIPTRTHSRKSIPSSALYTNAPPVTGATMKPSRNLSVRSTYSQASTTYLPPIAPVSQRLFDDSHGTNSVIEDYFQESPPVSRSGSLEQPPGARFP
ncbi:hypothetical protein DXG03_001772 [Asterophora parasitica]|uniref:Uncharacterized protein n=1 Tax=Asterophora parasitica TaxID=117018 RepID=A0A9P7G554_9AGAR|nr:hypothetical protein DXG03_001772 [Asterophora parasitica]